MNRNVAVSLLCVAFVIQIGLSSGKCIALSSEGHQEVTQKVAGQLLFSPVAIDVLTRGAVAPDFDNWNEPAAHAQTANDDHGKPTQTAEEGQLASMQYLQVVAGEFKKLLNDGDYGGALYLLGVGLHTIQDFAAHKGMTNTEHSYLAFGVNPSMNPDYDLQARDDAWQYTLEFLQQVQSAIGNDKWKSLQTLYFPGNKTFPDIPHITAPSPADMATYYLLKEMFIQSDSRRWDKPSVLAVKDMLIKNFACVVKGECTAALNPTNNTSTHCGFVPAPPAALASTVQ